MTTPGAVLIDRAVFQSCAANNSLDGQGVDHAGAGVGREHLAIGRYGSAYGLTAARQRQLLHLAAIRGEDDQPVLLGEAGDHSAPGIDREVRLVGDVLTLPAGRHWQLEPRLPHGIGVLNAGVPGIAYGKSRGIVPCRSPVLPTLA